MTNVKAASTRFGSKNLKLLNHENDKIQSVWEPHDKDLFGIKKTF